MKKVVGFSVLFLVITAVIVGLVMVNHNRLRFLAVAADETSLVVAKGNERMILFHEMDLMTGDTQTMAMTSTLHQYFQEKVQLDSLTPYKAELSWVFPSGNIHSLKIQLKSKVEPNIASGSSGSLYTIRKNKVVAYRPRHDKTMVYEGWCGIGKFSHLIDIARTGPYTFAADKGGIFSKGGIYGISPGDPYWRKITVF